MLRKRGADLTAFKPPFGRRTNMFRDQYYGARSAVCDKHITESEQRTLRAGREGAGQPFTANLLLVNSKKRYFLEDRELKAVSRSRD